MLYTQEFNIETFPFWSGAIDIVSSIIEADLLDELNQLIEDSFQGSSPSDTEINDFVWHESSYIFDTLGLDEDGEIKVEFFDEYTNEGLTINLNKHSLFFGEDTLRLHSVNSMTDSLIINNVNSNCDLRALFEEIEERILEEQFETNLFTPFIYIDDEELETFKNTDFYIELNFGFFAQFYRA